MHPGYLSARVTLGRALIELGHLDDAQKELERVLASTSENQAAIRGLAEIHHSGGRFAEALKYYRAALVLARNDPELQQTVGDLAVALEGKPPTASDDGLSFEQVTRELFQTAPPEEQPAAPPPVAGPDPETARAHARATIVALEQFLAAIHVARAQPSA